MPGLDWLQAASFEADSVAKTSCRVTQLKPPGSWKGTPASEEFDLDNLKEYTVLFEGPAREASSLYPKNANVATMLALATTGLDKTMVRLATDPVHLKGGTTVEYSNPEIGDIKIDVSNVKMLESNPKTSAVVPLSVLKAIRSIAGHAAIV